MKLGGLNTPCIYLCCTRFYRHKIVTQRCSYWHAFVMKVRCVNWEVESDIFYDILY